MDYKIDQIRVDNSLISKFKNYTRKLFILGNNLKIFL